MKDIIHGDVAIVFNILDLLPVTWRFLQSLDDKSGSRWNHINLSLTILNGQLDGDFETFPVLGGLGDIITNLLGRQTQRTDFGSQSGSSCYFTTDGTKADDLEKEEKNEAMITAGFFVNLP